MARVHPFQTNFTAGELTPKLAGQVDFKKYNNGVEVLENMTVFPQGGATRRYGTKFVAEVKDSSKITRLIPFEFNIEQSYILEFGDQYIRFFKDNGQITNATKNITNITQANPAVVTVASHGYTNDTDVWINSVVGMTELNGRRFRIANVTTNTFELSGVDSTSYTTYTSGGTVASVYEIASPFTESMLYDIQFTQSADVMYIVQETLEPRKLSRTGHTSWTLSTVEFINGPYLDDNDTSTTFTSSTNTVGASRTLTASSITGINDGVGFKSSDVGRLVRMVDGYGVITAFTSTTIVTWEIKLDIVTATATTDWALGAWSDDTWLS
jgi:hypothetical protein